MTNDKSLWAASFAAMTKDKNIIIKPSELIEIVGFENLSLNDRRVYNVLVQNAWPDIRKEKPVADAIYTIPKKSLKVRKNEADDTLGESIERLMGTIGKCSITKEGKPYIRRVQLLGVTDEPLKSDGLVYYHFSKELCELLLKSEQYAIIQKQVIFAFSSKYALALYEMIAKRINLKHKETEVMPLEEFRSKLGVNKDQLVNFFTLKVKAIDPAVSEVTQLVPEFSCKVEPLRGYRGKVDAVKLTWWKKTPDEAEAVYRENNYSKVGRKARREGKVERIVNTGHLTKGALPPRIASRRGLSTEDVEKLHDEFGAFAFEEIYNTKFKDFIASTSGDPDNVKNAYIRFSAWLRGKTSPIKGMAR